jgi:hypothetical protein
MIHWLKMWLEKFVRGWRPFRWTSFDREPPLHVVDPPPSTSEPEPERPDPEKIAEEIDKAQMNRALRKKYEKLRKKHDKFVQPSGDQPLHLGTRKPAPTVPTSKAQPPDLSNADSGMLIIDRHHEGGDKVLYEEREFFGSFNFRDTILEQLDRYFVYLYRMRRNDPDAYNFYRQVGGALLPYSSFGRFFEDYDNVKEMAKALDLHVKRRQLLKDVPPWFKEMRPAFGCVALGTDKHSEEHELKLTEISKKLNPKKGGSLWTPKFMYYTKYQDPPPDLQLCTGGDTYKLTIWWDRPQDPTYKRKWGTPQDFGMWVSDDGSVVKPLRQLAFHDGGYWREWRLPYAMKEWAKQHDINATEYMRHLFIYAIQECEKLGHNMIHVHVTNSKGLTCTFGVDEHRMGYFFKDRDIKLNQYGHRGHVFHWVRPHMRSNGVLVKGYFAGENEFTWAGYKVLITVPGKDHLMLDEINIGATDKDKLKPGETSLGQSEFGKNIADHIRSGDINDIVKGTEE